MMALGIRALRQHRAAAFAHAGGPGLHRDPCRHHQLAARHASFVAMPLVGYPDRENRRPANSGYRFHGGRNRHVSTCRCRVSPWGGFWDFWWPLLAAGLVSGICFCSPNHRHQRSRSRSIAWAMRPASFNLMRNIGASIGISIVETIQYARSKSTPTCWERT